MAIDNSRLLDKGVVLLCLFMKNCHPKKTNPIPAKNVRQMMNDLSKLAKEVSSQTKGISLSDKVIEMRYEQ